MVIIGITVFVASSYYLKSESTHSATKKVTQTTSWEKYTNPEFGYILHYPPTWRLVDNPDKDKGGTTQFFNYPEDKYIGGEIMQEGDVKIEIAYLKNPDNLTVEEFAIYTTDANSPEDKNHTHEEVNVGGVPYIRCTTEGETHATFYIEVKNGTILSITAYPYKVGSDTDTILSSFRTL